MAHTTYRRFLIASALAASAALAPLPCAAIVQMQGSVSDISHLVSLINQFAQGSSYVAVGSRLEHIHFASDDCEEDPSMCPNIFASEVSAQIRSPEVITLEIGRSLPGVVIGAFLGAGRQLIDLNDVDALPASDPFLPLRSSALLHEIVEVSVDVELRSLELPGGYAESHSTSLFYENEDLLSRGSTGQHLDGYSTSKTVGDLMEISVPWSDGSIRRDVFFLVDGALNIEDIRSGYFDTGVQYSGADRDIRISLIGISAVPETSQFAYTALGLAAISVIQLFGSHRARTVRRHNATSQRSSRDSI